MREIVFDVETTGLDPRKDDRITEIGCVEVIDFIPTGRTYQTYVNPERDVPKEAFEVTGLSTEFLRDKPLFASVAQEFLDFVGDARVIAHNASFDRGFINMELERCRLAPILEDRWVDTLEIARSMFPGAYNSLDALCKRFNVSLETRDKHGALIDCHLLAEVYLMLNGGRERALDFGDAAQTSEEIEMERGGRRARPTPLKPLSTHDERAAHAEFIATFGQESLWTRYGVSPVKSKSDA